MQVCSYVTKESPDKQHMFLQLSSLVMSLTPECRLADAYKTPETDRLSKVDYRRFCDDINTGELTIDTS